jgi:chromosome segregation ATPase
MFSISENGVKMTVGMILFTLAAIMIIATDSVEYESKEGETSFVWKCLSRKKDARAESLTKEVINLKDQIDDLKQDNVWLEDDVDDLEDSNLEKEGRIRALESDLKETLSSKKNDKDYWVKQVQNYEYIVDEKDQQIKALQFKIEHLEKKVGFLSGNEAQDPDWENTESPITLG